MMEEILVSEAAVAKETQIFILCREKPIRLKNLKHWKLNKLKETTSSIETRFPSWERELESENHSFSNLTELIDSSTIYIYFQKIHLKGISSASYDKVKNVVLVLFIVRSN